MVVLFWRFRVRYGTSGLKEHEMQTYELTFRSQLAGRGEELYVEPVLADNDTEAVTKARERVKFLSHSYLGCREARLKEVRYIPLT